MRYVDIREKPDKYMLNNKFLEREADSQVNDLGMSEIEKKRIKAKSLMTKLSGGFIPEIVRQLSCTKIGDELGVCRSHGTVKCQYCSIGESTLTLPKLSERNPTVIGSELKLGRILDRLASSTMQQT